MSATVLITLPVTNSHIAEMEDVFDSGMCDPGKSNAICLAMRSEPQLPAELRVYFQQDDLVASLFGHCLPLSKEAGTWLHLAMTGRAVKPASFQMELPSFWFCQPKAADRKKPKEEQTLARASTAA